MRPPVKKIVILIAVLIIFSSVMGVIPVHAENSMTIRYDDYINISGKTVKIVDAGKPTSYQVGYKVADGTPDKAVITKSGDYLVATGIGTAKVSIDGFEWTITVEPAPISIFLLIGQSNMYGSEGNAKESIACEEGQVYSTFAPKTLSVANARNYVASTLAGEKKKVSIYGTQTELASAAINSISESGSGKVGPDSGIGYEWTMLTGEKVWLVNAAHGGSNIESWQPDGSNYQEATTLFKYCLRVLGEEIAAGHYTFSHMGYFWCQGESNPKQSAEWYVEQFLNMHESLKKEALVDIDSNPETPDVTFEFCGLIPVRKGSTGNTGYRMGTYPAEYIAASKNILPYESFEDLRMTGPRVAQYWMGNNPELEDIWNVSTIQEKWVTFPDGTNGVEAYFKAQYPNGRVNYPTQTAVGESWRKPTTPADVHDSIHYNQIGYNEIGREAARNALYNLGIITPPETEVTVEFISWDGFTPVTEITPVYSAQSASLIVPMVSPVYRSKDVTYKVDEGFTYTYYDLVADHSVLSGGITPVGADGEVLVIEKSPTLNYSWKFDGEGVPSSVGENQNDPVKVSDKLESNGISYIQYALTDNAYLYHDENWAVEWTMQVSSHEGTQVLLGTSLNLSDAYSFGIMVDSAAQSISIGRYNSSTVEKCGVCLAEYGIDMAESHNYRLVNIPDGEENMIYLFVDGRKISPMNNILNEDGSDSGKDGDLVVNRDLRFVSIGAPKYRLVKGAVDSIDILVHGHDYEEAVTPTTCTRNGYTTYTCSCGDSYTLDEAAATGHVYDDEKDSECNVCGETRGSKGGCGAVASPVVIFVSVFAVAILKKKRV